MISRHITTHDENGSRLVGIGREIYRTPTQIQLDKLAASLIKRGRSVTYSQCACADGMVIFKAYPCGGRMIADGVFFSSAEDLAQLYQRAPLGDGLFFENAPKLDRPVALPTPDISKLIASADYDEFSRIVNALFPDEDMLAETICALRTGRVPLAMIGDMAPGEFSRKLYFALNAMLRALPLEIAIKLEYLTMCGAGEPCGGASGFSTNDEGANCAAYIYLPDGTRDLRVTPSSGDYSRAEALLAGSLRDVLAERDADDSIAPSETGFAESSDFEPLEPETSAAPQPAESFEQYAPRATEKTAAAPAAQFQPTMPIPQPVAQDDSPEVVPNVSQQEIDIAQQMLSASIRYANSHEFRQFTKGFMQLKRTMDAPLFFQYVLRYSDCLHRIDHPMCETYDIELASLYENPPAGLISAQIALTLMGYPGALKGALKHIERAGLLDSFICDSLPPIKPAQSASDYALTLITERQKLLKCLPESQSVRISSAITNAVNSGIAEAFQRVTADVLNDVHAALDTLLRSVAQLSDDAFDRLVSVLIDRMEFKRLDEYSEATYPALNFAYSYVKQWDGQVTDKQRAICLWGRLMYGCSEWGGCVMEGMLRLLAPMNPVNRVDFMGFVRRYFAAMCAGGLDKSQMSESVVMITMLTALRFDAQNNWKIDELSDVLDRLNAAGEGLERTFWQQINTRVDLLPVDMLEAAHAIDGKRANRALGYGDEVRPSSRLNHTKPEPKFVDDDDQAQYPETPEYQDIAEAETEPAEDGTPAESEDYEPPLQSRPSARGRNYTPYDYPRPRSPRERTQDGETRYRVQRGAYEQKASARASEYQAEREPELRNTGARKRRSHSYSYDSGDSSPDDGYGGSHRSAVAFADRAERYRQTMIYERARKHERSAETLMLGGLLLLVIGALAFCVINFLI